MEAALKGFFLHSAIKKNFISLVSFSHYFEQNKHEYETATSYLNIIGIETLIPSGHKKYL